MKNLILLFCLSLISSVNAQIQLEHTYVTNLSVNFDNSFPGDDGNMDFYVVRANGGNGNYALDLYDGATHVMYKSMPMPQDYVGTANNTLRYTDSEQPKYFISKHLFNDDDLIEFVSCVQYFNPFGNGISAPKVVISNEQGTILQTIYDRYAPRVVKTGDNTYKLLVSVGGSGVGPFYGSGSVSIDVYSLPGTLSLGQEEAYVSDSGFQGYPNPTSNKITISKHEPLSEDTQLEIFDMAGKKLQSQKVTAGTTDIVVDASDLSDGVYFYKINGVTGKFIKK